MAFVLYQCALSPFVSLHCKVQRLPGRNEKKKTREQMVFFCSSSLGRNRREGGFFFDKKPEFVSHSRKVVERRHIVFSLRDL